MSRDFSYTSLMGTIIATILTILYSILPAQAPAQGSDGDFCPQGTYPGLVCEQDWPCSAIPSRIREGDCWVEVR